MSGRRVPPQAPARRGWCPGLNRPMPTGDGLLARIHPPLGLVSPAQLRAVAEAALAFGNGHVDLTARANLQIRGVSEATRGPLAEALAGGGLGDARGDGGPQRLTLASPLCGLAPALIDGQAVAARIEALGRAVAPLPAKTLVAVEAGGACDLPGLEADIHVRAAAPGRARIGLATGAEPLWLAERPEAAVAEAVAALLHGFSRTGVRRVRDLTDAERAALSLPSPSRALADDGGPMPSSTVHERGAGPLSRAGEGQGEGPGAFRIGRGGVVPPPERSHPSPQPSPARERGHGAVLARAEAWGRHSDKGSNQPEADPQVHMRPPSLNPSRACPPWAEADRSRAGPGSVGGGKTVIALDAAFGRCTAAMLLRLADAAEAAGAVDIRLSPSRGFVLAADPTRAEAARARLAADFITEPDDPRRAVAACPGAPACASGSTPTQDDAARLAEAFRPFAARGLRAHVSGCAKGCAAPHRSDLTLVGEGGLYGVVPGGAAGDAPVERLTIEAALERVRGAQTANLEDLFRTST